MKAIFGAPVALMTLLFGAPAVAQSTPDVAISVTGQHRAVRDVALGKSTDDAIQLTLTFSPGSGSRVASASTEYQEPSTSGDAALESVQYEGEAETAGPGDVPLDPLERDELSGLSDVTTTKGRLRGAPTNQEAELSRAPFVVSPEFVRQVLDAATTAQGLQSALSRLEGLGTRSRTSALLPEVRFRVGRDVDNSLRLTPTDEDPYRYTQTGGVSTIIEGSATFRLNRLLFANEELGVERLRLAQMRERQRLSVELIEELLRWEQAYRVAQSGTLAGRRAQMQLHESALRLDAMTNGWFQAHAPALPPARERARERPTEPAPGARDGTAPASAPKEAPPPQVGPASRPGGEGSRRSTSKGTASLRVQKGDLEYLATSR